MTTITVSTMSVATAAADVRCRGCGKLVFRWVHGSATIDIKCPRCGASLIVNGSTSHLSVSH